MARVRTPNQKKAYNALNNRLTQYVSQVQSIYDMANRRMAEIAASTGYDGEVPFSFKDYPELAEAVKDVQAQFVNEIGTTIMRGTSEEWRQSNLIQDLLADKVLKHYRAQVHGKRFKKYYQTNSDALKAFQNRRDRGMNLSAKLWGQADEYTMETEAAISCTISNAIEKGMSAITLSKRLSKYLHDYPSLQHDYWETYGKAANIHDCEYRSIRLARSEINMAYRTAEQERWKQFDFITGYEIKLSGSHPAHDICDSLAGKYPKDFVWTGWHPNDMCYAIPIIMSEDEYWNMEDDGEKPDMITDVPQGYKDWVTSNLKRIKAADDNGTLPYFLKDNPDFRKYLGTDYVAEYRHRTRNAKEIQTAWDNRRAMMENHDYLGFLSFRTHANYIGFDISELETLVRNTDLKYSKYGESSIYEQAFDKLQKEYFEVRTEVNESYRRLSKLCNSAKLYIGPYKIQSAIDEMEEAMGDFSTITAKAGQTYSAREFDKAYRSAKKKLDEAAKKANAANDGDIETALGIKKGHPMSFLEADQGRGNIRYTGRLLNPYSINCQVCVVADELRRRGYDVTAIGRIEGSGMADKIAHHTELPWFEKNTGRIPIKKRIGMSGKSVSDIYIELDTMTTAKGRYHIDWGWAGGTEGHIVCLERRANGTLRFYDPQNGQPYDIFDIIRRSNRNYPLNVLKVDDLLVDPRIIRSIVKPL